MKPSTSYFSVVVLFFLAAAHVLLPSSNAQLPPCISDPISVPPMQDFSPGWIIPSWWYLQEYFFRRPEEIVEPRGICVQQHTEFAFEDQLLLWREDYTNSSNGGEYMRRSWFVEFYYPQENPAILTLMSSYYPEIILEHQATWIATDYKTYAVVHYCTYEGFQTRVPGEHIVIMTGSATPNETLLEELRGMVAGVGFPTEHSVKVDTEDCSYCTGLDDCPYYDTPYDDEIGGKLEETDF